RALGLDVSLLAFTQATNLIIKAERARTAACFRKQRLFGVNRGSSPRVSKGVRVICALSHGRATAPITCPNARDQRRETCFFKNVADVVARDRVSPETNLHSSANEFCEWSMTVPKFGVRFWAMGYGRVVFRNQLDI